MFCFNFLEEKPGRVQIWLATDENASLATLAENEIKAGGICSFDQPILAGHVGKVFCKNFFFFLRQIALALIQLHDS